MIMEDKVGSGQDRFAPPNLDYPANAVECNCYWVLAPLHLSKILLVHQRNGQDHPLTTYLAFFTLEFLYKGQNEGCFATALILI